MGEQLVVVAEFEELGVGVFEELDGGFGAGGVVVEEGAVPADDGEVVGVIGDAGLENFLALAVGERRVFAANNLCDAAAFGGEEIVGGGIAGDVADVEDKVVFGEPLAVGAGFVFVGGLGIARLCIVESGLVESGLGESGLGECGVGGFGVGGLGFVGLDEGGIGAVEFLLDDFAGEGGEVGVPNPAAGEADEGVPVAGEGEFEDDG